MMFSNQEPTMPIKTICVFCGGRQGVDETLAQMTQGIGKIIAEAGIGIVYGGSQAGLMGVIADSVLGAGGRVVGILPEMLDRIEPAHTGLSDLVRTPCLATRKQHMMDASDAFLVLPGGYGTLDELAEVLVLSKIQAMKKPIIVMNPDGFWDALFAQIDRMIDEKFVLENEASLMHVANNLEEFRRLIQQMCPMAV
jgi:uncharacterized protein (TIGR00730 family)